MNYLEKINAMRAELIERGFDYPNQDIKTATEKELEEFYQEAVNFLEAK